ncbi:hypothetical protein G7046_g2590 [Stylonectria norvegica]|nr:hypothetical protein G7046_g2590 [Stylonectria norvegica]
MPRIARQGNELSLPHASARPREAQAAQERTRAQHRHLSIHSYFELERNRRPEMYLEHPTTAEATATAEATQAVNLTGRPAKDQGLKPLHQGLCVHHCLQSTRVTTVLRAIRMCTFVLRRPLLRDHALYYMYPNPCQKPQGEVRERAGGSEQTTHGPGNAKTGGRNRCTPGVLPSPTAGPTGSLPTDTPGRSCPQG